MSKWKENTRKVFSFLVPGFLKRFDQYLLTHYPLVWRTRIHYFFFYFLFLGNLAAWYWGQSIAIPIDDLPSMTTLNYTVIYLQFIAVLILAAWAFDQYQLPLSGALQRYFPLTFLLYVFCIFSLAFSTNMVFQSVIPRIGNLVPDEGFEASYQLHAENEFWEYDEDPKFQAAYREHKEQIVKDLLQYRALPESAASTLQFGGLRTWSGLTYVDSEGQRHHIGEESFGSRISIIRDAKNFWKEGAYYEEFNYWKILLGISIVLALLLALRVHFHAFFIRNERALLRFFRVNTKLPEVQNTSISEMENWLITRQPYIWSTKLHKLLKVLFGMIPIILLTDLIVYIWTGGLFFFSVFFKEEQSPDHVELINWEGISFGTAITLFSFIFGLLWSFQQHRRKELPPRFWDNIGLFLIYHVMACIFFIGISSLILFTNANAKGGIGFFSLGMPYIGLLVASIIYLSKFIKRRRAMIGIPLVGAMIASLLIGVYVGLYEEFIEGSEWGYKGNNGESSPRDPLLWTYILICLWLLYGLGSALYRKVSSSFVLILAAAYFTLTSIAVGVIVTEITSDSMSEGGEGLFTIISFNLIYPIICILMFLPMIQILLRLKRMPAVE